MLEIVMMVALAQAPSEWATATPKQGDEWVTARKKVVVKVACPCGCGCTDCDPSKPCGCGCPCGLSWTGIDSKGYYYLFKGNECIAADHASWEAPKPFGDGLPKKMPSSPIIREKVTVQASCSS